VSEVIWHFWSNPASFHWTQEAILIKNDQNKTYNRIRMSIYAHETLEWPQFRWDCLGFGVDLARVHFRRGALVTAMGSLGFELQQETILSTLVQDVTQTSEIEGEHLDAGQVRSSIAVRLGLDRAGLPAADRHVEGVVDMTLDATQHFAQPLDAERLFGWHAALFPTGRSALRRIIVGDWRDDREGPMLVLSGPLDHQKVHSPNTLVLSHAL